jgi:nucleotidyltransferase/DNA polymerase involved in DNA repair
MRTNRSAEVDQKRAAVLKDLQRIPGIGPSLAKDLADLGIRRVNALRGRSPERLYERLCQLRGVHQDRCVLYTFRCAVYFATEANPDSERLKWWNWQDRKSTPRNSRSASSLRAV